MKMREFQYTSNGLDICCQGNDSEQHSKCFSRCLSKSY